MIQMQVVSGLYGVSGAYICPVFPIKCLLHSPSGSMTGEGVGGKVTFSGSLLTDDKRCPTRNVINKQ